MRRAALVLIAAGSLGLGPRSAPPPPWGVSLARLAGAAANAEEAAAALESSARAAGATGRLRGWSAVESDARLLERQVASLGLAAANLREAAPAPPVPTAP
jgi:hypothetical protein